MNKLNKAFKMIIFIWILNPTPFKILFNEVRLLGTGHPRLEEAATG